jgi:hypothetical protein
MNELADTEDFSHLSADELIKRMSFCGLGIPPALAQEIIARGREAVPALCRIVSSPRWWHKYGDEAAAVIHAMHLLGAIGDPAAAPALLAPIGWEEPSDFITDSMPGILARLGPGALPALRAFVEDPDQDSIMRSVVYEGLEGMAILHPELSNEVKDIARQLARRCLANAEPFPAGVGASLAAYQDAADLALLKPLYDRGLWDQTWMCDWDDILEESKQGRTGYQVEYVTRDPMDYFAPQEQERLRRLWWGEEDEDEPAQDGEDKSPQIPWTPAPPPAAVGRNQPCPCGSGKKYKRCCGRSSRS